MLKNEYLLAKIGFDTAENEPSKVWTCLPAPSPPLIQLRMQLHVGPCLGCAAGCASGCACAPATNRTGAVRWRCPPPAGTPPRAPVPPPRPDAAARPDREAVTTSSYPPLLVAFGPESLRWREGPGAASRRSAPREHGPGFTAARLSFGMRHRSGGVRLVAALRCMCGCARRRG